MKLKITDFESYETPLQQIKGLRESFRETVGVIGLKESKEAFDACKHKNGHATFIIPDEQFTRLSAKLDQYGITYEVIYPHIDVNDFLSALNEFPENMSVGDVIDSIRATKRIFK